MDTKNTQKVISQLLDTLDDMRQQLKLLSIVQMTIVDSLSAKDRTFMAKFVAATLSVKDIRDDFTNFVMNNNDVSDAAKLFTMDINEHINTLLEEE